MLGGQPRELTPQSLDLGRAIQPQQSAERHRVSLLELLGTRDAQQRHQQQRQQRRAQPVEGRADATVELASDQQEPALEKRRQGEEHPCTGDL